MCFVGYDVDNGGDDEENVEEEDVDLKEEDDVDLDEEEEDVDPVSKVYIKTFDTSDTDSDNYKPYWITNR